MFSQMLSVNLEARSFSARRVLSVTSMPVWRGLL